MQKEKSKGYIQLPRNFTEHPLYGCEKFSPAMAFLDLLFIANFKPSYYLNKGKRVDVGIGQFAIGQETLARKWRWTRKAVNRFLKQLESVHELVQHKTGTINLYTIVKYKHYTSHGTASGTRNGTVVGTVVGTHPKERERKGEERLPVSAENGFAPIRKLKP